MLDTSGTIANNFIGFQKFSSLADSDVLEAAGWKAIAKTRLAELLALENNWDSYGARTISVDLARTALDLLEFLMSSSVPLPDIVPTSSGGLQLEWHIGSRHFEVEIVTPALSIAYYLDAEVEGDEEEFEITYELSELQQAFSKLNS